MKLGWQAPGPGQWPDSDFKCHYQEPRPFNQPQGRGPVWLQPVPCCKDGDRVGHFIRSEAGRQLRRPWGTPQVPEPHEASTLPIHPAPHSLGTTQVASPMHRVLFLTWVQIAKIHCRASGREARGHHAGAGTPYTSLLFLDSLVRFLAAVPGRERSRQRTSSTKPLPGFKAGAPQAPIRSL